MKIREYGYEYDAVFRRDVWENFKEGLGEVSVNYSNIMCLRSGRDALKLIASNYENQIVFLPALACDSMIVPFEMYNFNINYYSLNEDYSVDFSTLFLDLKKAKDKKCILLYMDYFGNQSFDDQQLNILKSTYKNLMFLEDRTHNILLKSNRLFIPEFTIASLRKWINIPDGGILWFEKELKLLNFCNDTSFFKNRLSAQCLRNQYLNNGNEEIKKKYREIFSSVSKILDEDKLPGKMSKYSLSILKNADWDNIRKIRQENSRILINIFKQNNITLIQNKEGLSDLYVPILVPNRNEIQKKLSQKNIFNTIIWPLRDSQMNICQTAKKTCENMLAVPCDQRYDSLDMEFIGNEIVKEVMNEKNYDIRG